jgi:tRNA pseudouridine65 synthase
MHNVIFTEPPEIEVIYQDSDIVAINKPSGLLVHKSPIDKAEKFFALQATRDAIGQKVFPIHRLDKPTSGVLLFALNSEVAKIMADKFLNHEIQKHYLAFVRGYTPEHLEIDYPLKRLLDKIADKDKSTHFELQDARSSLTTIGQAELDIPNGRFETSRYSLVRLSPSTGRKHQLRRHMAHIRHPIIGDTNHGDGKQNKLARQHLSLNRLALHAESIEFNHPVSGNVISISALTDAELSRIFKLCTSAKNN